MIIESKFVDYYDSFVAKFCRDEKLVYKRFPEEIPLKSLDKRLRYLTRIGSLEIFRKTRADFPILESSCSVGIFYINEKVYPFLVEENGEISYDDVYEKFNSVSLRTKERTRFLQKWKLSDLKRYPTISFGGRLEIPDAPVPVLMIHPNLAGEVKAILNPVLHDYKFPLSVQQISQEIMGSLSIQDLPIPVRNQNEIASSKGFNKNSFRAERGGPTRKRKK